MHKFMSLPSIILVLQKFNYTQIYSSIHTTATIWEQLGGPTLIRVTLVATSVMKIESKSPCVSRIRCKTIISLQFPHCCCLAVKEKTVLHGCSTIVWVHVYGNILRLCTHKVQAIPLSTGHWLISVGENNNCNVRIAQREKSLSPQTSPLLLSCLFWLRSKKAYNHQGQKRL